MIAAYAMDAPASFYLISFYYIFIIPNPSLGIFNIITHTNIIIGFVTRNVLSIILLVHSFNRTRSLLTRSTMKKKEKEKEEIFQSIKRYGLHPDVNCLPLLSYYQRD